MASSEPILVTAALPYANGDIHLGHLVGYIQADIWVRWQKNQGTDCQYICGTDAHGTPVMLKAQELGISPGELAAQAKQRHEQDFATFGVAFDNYHTTDSPENADIVHEIYQKLDNANTIFQKEIQQAFDEEKQMFLPDRFIRGICPRCKAPDQYGDSCEVCGATYAATELLEPRSVLSDSVPSTRSSTHYFFDLGQFSDDLRQWLAQTDTQQEVKQKLKEWLDNGLVPWDISRDAPYFGFNIPGTDDKFLYVWLDAPMGYIASHAHYAKQKQLDWRSAWQVGSRTKLYHFIGKDIAYFHLLFWPAVLKAADMRRPDGVYVNGFLTINGQKMSKSRGTFILANTFAKHVEPEYLRYYFAAKLSDSVEDIDLNLEDFVERINADLVGKFSNIASRLAPFIAKYFDNTLAASLEMQELEPCLAAQATINTWYQQRKYSHIVRKVMALADSANRFIDAQKPWVHIKDPKEHSKVHATCSIGLNIFRILAVYLAPITPKLWQQCCEFLALDPKAGLNLQSLLTNHKINSFKALAQRVTQEAIANMKQEAAQQSEPKATPSGPKRPLKPEITFEDFAKIDLRVVKIVDAKHVEGADKLLALTLDLDGCQKQVFAGIKSAYQLEDLIGKLTVMVANLAPRKMRFGLSEGMVLAASDKPDNPGLWLLEPHTGAPIGAVVS